MESGKRVPCVETAFCNPHGSLASQHSTCLRLLTFNAQAGIHTQHYGHYVTRAWQHLLPSASRQRSLAHIGAFLSQFDVVALQEVDGGSWRSGDCNQVEFLAHFGHFPYFYQQVNRNLGRLAQHSNGLLSRWPIVHLENHPLPGMSGRGAIVAQLGSTAEPIVIVATHLALRASTRRAQLSYICQQVQHAKHVVLMGDLNASVEELRTHPDVRALALHTAQEAATYPSWQPLRCIDHILLSPTLRVQKASVLDAQRSDHRPVAVDIHLPDALCAPRGAA